MLAVSPEATAARDLHASCDVEFLRETRRQSEGAEQYSERPSTTMTELTWMKSTSIRPRE
jgi:hypothetical protein